MANFHLTSIKSDLLDQFSKVESPQGLSDLRQAGGMNNCMITAVRRKTTAVQTEQRPFHLVPPALRADLDLIGPQGDHHPSAASRSPERDQPDPGQPLLGKGRPFGGPIPTLGIGYQLFGKK